MFGATNSDTSDSRDMCSTEPGWSNCCSIFSRNMAQFNRVGATSSITCASAVRTLFRYVRAPKKPARWAASCTESENAISFLSSLNTLAQLLSTTCEPSVALRAPISNNSFCSPQAGQVLSCRVYCAWPITCVFWAVTRNTDNSSWWPQARHSSWLCCMVPQATHTRSVTPSTCEREMLSEAYSRAASGRRENQVL